MRLLHRAPLTTMTAAALLSLFSFVFFFGLLFAVIFMDDPEIKASTVVILLTSFFSISGFCALISVLGVVGGIAAIRRFLRSNVTAHKTRCFQIKRWLKILYCGVCALVCAAIAGVVIFYGGIIWI